MSTTALNFKKTGRYPQEVKGESHYQQALEDNAEINRLVEVELQLEDHNPHDKNAVEVAIGLETVGYLPTEDAPRYRAALKRLGHSQAVGVCNAKITGGGEDRSYGIVLDLDIDHLEIENIVQTKLSPLLSAKPASSPAKTAPIKKTNKIPFISIKGKGCLFFFGVLPLIAIINFYILLFWLVSKGVQWLWKIATATPQSKKISLIAVGSLTALWIISALISALLQAVGVTKPIPPAPTVDLVAVQNTALAQVWQSYTQTAAALPTNTLASTNTPAPLPTQTLAPVATATTFISILPGNQTPAQRSAPVIQDDVCSCLGDTLNCSDFSSHSSAQACHDYCISQGAGDIHGLDKDGNGSACESLP